MGALLTEIYLNERLSEKQPLKQSDVLGCRYGGSRLWRYPNYFLLSFSFFSRLFSSFFLIESEECNALCFNILHLVSICFKCA